MEQCWALCTQNSAKAKAWRQLKVTDNGTRWLAPGYAPWLIPGHCRLALVGEPFQRSAVDAEQRVQQIILKINIARKVTVPFAQENRIVDREVTVLVSGDGRIRCMSCKQ